MALQWRTATDEQIIHYCSRSNPGRNVISELAGGISVIRISDAVVKCGIGITESEASNQKRVCEIRDPKVIRVP
ncbi:hypothetical protein DM02DRAFT_494967, partial [Periconia macrospinosa]